MAVLAKPGKTTAQKETPGGCRLMALLGCVDEALERVLTNRSTAAAEQHDLLLDGQFGNRHGRSTEAAEKFVVQGVRAAWKADGPASLLELVHHSVLIGRLRGVWFARWFLQWLQAYISGCTVT